MAIETQGFTFITSGRKRESLTVSLSSSLSFWLCASNSKTSSVQLVLLCCLSMLFVKDHHLICRCVDDCGFDIWNKRLETTGFHITVYDMLYISGPLAHTHIRTETGIFETILGETRLFFLSVHILLWWWWRWSRINDRFAAKDCRAWRWGWRVLSGKNSKLRVGVLSCGKGLKRKQTGFFFCIFLYILWISIFAGKCNSSSLPTLSTPFGV